MHRWPDSVAVSTRHLATGSAGRLVGTGRILGDYRLLDNWHGAPKTVASIAAGIALPPTPNARRTATSVQRIGTDIAVPDRFPVRDQPPERPLGPARGRSSVTKTSLRHLTAP